MSAAFPVPSFAAMIVQLCGLIARHGLARGLAGPFIIEIWQRVRTTATQIETLLARVQAGTIRRHVSRRPPHPRAARRRATPGPWRRKRAWLVVLLPETAGNAAQLQHMLDAPGVPALLAAAPQLRRRLRPLCHMLGVTLPRAPGPAATEPPREPGAAIAPAKPPPATPNPAAPPAPALAPTPQEPPTRTPLGPPNGPPVGPP